MLKTRFLTALILVPLVVLGVFKLDAAAFALVTAGIVLIGGWELARIAGLTQSLLVAGYLLALAAAMYALTWLADQRLLEAFFLLVALWWLLFLFTVLGGRLNKRVAGVGRYPTLIGGALLLLAAWGAINAIRSLPEFGPGLLMFLLLLIWVADSGAYFSGRSFGRNKLAPVISPGKTWEGVYGALLGALVCALVVYFSGWLGEFELPWIVLLCLVTAMVSVGGDLWESLLKRHAGVKDSGHLLPGHGGVLDRIDSLIAASPFFLAGLGLMGRL